MVSFPHCSLPGRTGRLFTVLASLWLRKAAVRPSLQVVASVSIKKITCNAFHKPGGPGSARCCVFPRPGWQLRVLSPSPEDTVQPTRGGRCGERCPVLGRQDTTVPPSPWQVPKWSKCSPQQWISGVGTAVIPGCDWPFLCDFPPAQPPLLPWVLICFYLDNLWSWLGY